MGVFEISTPGRSINVLGKQAMTDLADCLHQFNIDHEYEGGVIMSKNLNCFVAGADINMFTESSTAEDFTQLSKSFQVVK